MARTRHALVRSDEGIAQNTLSTTKPVFLAFRNIKRGSMSRRSRGGTGRAVRRHGGVREEAAAVYGRLDTAYYWIAMLARDD